MSVATSHQISTYYDYFRDKEIVFTKANIKALKADPRGIYLKCNGGQWPCIINSVSLRETKVFVGTSSGFYQQILKNKQAPVSIRFAFFDQNNEPVQFFVNAIVVESKPYEASTDLVIMNLQYTQRPSDDLISRVGEFLQVNENFNTKKDEKILLNKETVRLLSLPKEESYIFIGGVPRKCVLKTLSFGGATIMLVGIPKFLIEKPVDLRMFFADTNDKLSIQGVVKTADFLPGRKDICMITVEFLADSVPMAYKFHINNFITSFQKQLIQRQMENKSAEEKAEAEAAAKKAELEAKKAQIMAQNDKDAAKQEAEANAKKALSNMQANSAAVHNSAPTANTAAASSNTAAPSAESTTKPAAGVVEGKPSNNAAEAPSVSNSAAENSTAQ
ncbi:MAG: pilus assembly protein PilZ [Spirochaetales bacterium]|nr:pilus assembly protein PilZ [Spirochaetales bacterium]